MLAPPGVKGIEIQKRPGEEGAQAAGRRPRAGSAARGGGSAAGGSGGGRATLRPRWVMALGLSWALGVSVRCVLSRPPEEEEAVEEAASPAQCGAPPRASAAGGGGLMKPRAINPRATGGRL